VHIVYYRTNAGGKSGLAPPPRGSSSRPGNPKFMKALALFAYNLTRRIQARADDVVGQALRGAAWWWCAKSCASVPRPAAPSQINWGFWAYRGAGNDRSGRRGTLGTAPVFRNIDNGGRGR
jgi:hypothetical protein